MKNFALYVPIALIVTFSNHLKTASACLNFGGSGIAPGLGENCYLQNGTAIQCQQNLICSPDTKACQRGCDNTMCTADIPNCQNGMKVLPRDPSKCRCCGNTCGNSDSETSCVLDRPAATSSSHTKRRKPVSEPAYNYGFPKPVKNNPKT